VQTKIKICGITRYEDARMIVRLGVDALGFIFVSKSPRYITAGSARQITAKLPPFVAKVGVFVNETAEVIQQTCEEAGLTAIQLHGEESPEFCQQFSLPVIKAFSVGPSFDLLLLDQYSCSAFLLDTWDTNTRGGTGKTFDWRIAEKASLRYEHIILAGGLGPSNISEALQRVAPYGVDLNSGLEISPGVKNPQKVLQAVKTIRSYTRDNGR